eukprot:c5045_g1_i3.p1 GENE.c5045_g1_i3~~c5045_g1_i3.p1  ORF type:complete len:314 (-),score=40.59 c5045_g1_i3:23-964(-)
MRWLATEDRTLLFVAIAKDTSPTNTSIFLEAIRSKFVVLYPQAGKTKESVDFNAEYLRILSVVSTLSVKTNDKAHNDSDIDCLLENNKIWVQQMKGQDEFYFARLGIGQKPAYLYIGCSDSRVPANQILGLPAGEVFVHRNVGNLMPVSDINSLSVVEYAVEVLDVKHIMVAGHYNCGAVNAAMQKRDWGLVECWIRNIRDVYKTHRQELDSIVDSDDRSRRLVELSVIEQCLNLYKCGVIQRKRLASGADPNSFKHPRIHALVFDPCVGVLKKLPVCFDEERRQYSHIYNLTSSTFEALSTSADHRDSQVRP